MPPLPVRDGLGPARVRLRGGAVLVELADRFGEAAAAKVLAGEVVRADGAVVTAATVLPPNSHVYLYRDLPDEVPVPFDMPVLYRDDDIVVVDKPHFLATMPRGGHVAQTATVRLRRELDLPELSPAHRLDRLTAGVLLFTVRREVRGSYQTLFARGEVRKTYLARAAVDPKLEFSMTVRSRIIKERGRLQAFEEPGEPNAETFIEHLGDGLYRLTPRTGRTHQLRVHMASLGPADHRRPAVSGRRRRRSRRLLHTAAAAGTEHPVRRSDQGMFASLRQRAQYRPMTGVTVGRLWQYPVKSMQGQEVDEIVLGPGGVAGDRAYGFVDVESGRLASAKRPRRFGALLDCQARFLSPPTPDGDSPPVEVTFPDGDVIRTDDGGAELTKRVTELLGREVQLISTAPEGIALDELIPQMEGLGENALDAMATEPDSDGDSFIPIPAAMAAPGTLLDLAAMHVMATSTLAWMADAHPGGEWDPRRMRPNILIDDSAEPGNEDDWLGCDVHVGEQAVVHIVGPTPRCVMTTLAQPGLAKDSNVLKTVARLNMKEMGALGQFPCAGSYAEVVAPGAVRRGDPIRFERVEPRKGALAATIEMMTAALSTGK